MNQYVRDSRSLNPEQIDRLSMILYRASGNNLERARAIIESERDSARHGSVDNLNAIEAKESAYQNAKLLDGYYRSPQHRLGEGVQIAAEFAAPYTPRKLLLPFRAMLVARGTAQAGHGIHQVAEGDTWQGVGNIFLGTIGGIAPGTFKYSSGGVFPAAERVVQQEEIISQIVNRGGKLLPAETTLSAQVAPSTRSLWQVTTRPRWQASPNWESMYKANIVPKMEGAATRWRVPSTGASTATNSLLSNSGGQANIATGAYLKRDLAAQAGIPLPNDIAQNPAVIWGKNIEQIKQSFELEGATLSQAPTRPSSSGLAKVYNVENSASGIKQIEFQA